MVLVLIVDFFQVHFKSGIGGDPSIAAEVSQTQAKLNEEEKNVFAARRKLESSVAEVDKLNDVRLFSISFSIPRC
jgi:hypothetical protein